MVLDRHRRVLDWWLDPLTHVVRRVHPDVFTWLSLAVAILGGVLFWASSPGYAGRAVLLAAWACVGLNSILDLLDGKVAKLTNQATPRGDFLDHAIDRFSDTAFLVGIALSPWSPTPWIGLLAVGFTLLTSYMGTQAQAVGLKRNYGGWLGRADRMVLLLFLPLIQFGWSEWNGGPLMVLGRATNFLELVMAYFAVVGALTTVQRFAMTLRSFGPGGKLP
ncbi:MAG: archaetidylinositol phosphate synthase [Thermoplasmata archaeon]|jgi:archaetidylinositol phosphate synthase|nr:archaetidylinositol phosphate synthase [Thermoplasmata archaeon]